MLGDMDAASEANIKKLSEVYLAKARRNGASATALEAQRVRAASIAP